jgi:hypothetical protein
LKGGEMAKKKAKKRTRKPKITVVDDACYEIYPLGEHRIWLKPKIIRSNLHSPQDAMNKAQQWAKDIKARKNEKIVDVLFNKDSTLVIAKMYWNRKSDLVKHLTVLCEIFDSPSAKIEIGRKLSGFDGRPEIYLGKHYQAPGYVRIEGPRPMMDKESNRIFVDDGMANSFQPRKTKVTIDDNLIYLGDEIGARAIKSIIDNAVMERAKDSVRECVDAALNKVFQSLRNGGHPKVLVDSINKLREEITIKMTDE